MPKERMFNVYEKLPGGEYILIKNNLSWKKALEIYKNLKWAGLIKMEKNA